MRGKRSVVRFFIVADLIVHGDGTCGEFHDIADGKRFKSHATGIGREGNRRRIHGDDIAEQSRRLRLGEGNERGLLCAVGVRINEKYGLSRKRIAVRITESSAGTDDGNDVQTGKRYAVPFAGADLPGEDGI